jgi:hypothetical protein
VKKDFHLEIKSKGEKCKGAARGENPTAAGASQARKLSYNYRVCFAGGSSYMHRTVLRGTHIHMEQVVQGMYICVGQVVQGPYIRTKQVAQGTYISIEQVVQGTYVRVVQAGLGVYRLYKVIQEKCNVPIFGFPCLVVRGDLMSLCQLDQRSKMRITVSSGNLEELYGA